MPFAQVTTSIASDQTRGPAAIGGGSDAPDARQAAQEDDILSTDENPDMSVAQVNSRSARLRSTELLTVDRPRDEFLATVCHELRAPLASIRHAVGVLRSRGADNEVQHSMHALIDRQVRHMTLLVADLLEVSRITWGHLHLRTERVDLRLVVRNAIETVEWCFKQRKQRFTAIWPDSPVWLHADTTRLEQVFVNLLTNASKYTDAGREIALAVDVREDSAVVRIRDCGIGIAADVLPHIFDLFAQAREAVLRSADGLGVGLTLVRMLVELHGGSVSAASAGLGHGSEFAVRLPVLPGSISSLDGADPALNSEPAHDVQPDPAPQAVSLIRSLASGRPRSDSG